MHSIRGFTLVEIMIAMGLTASVGLGSLALLDHLGKGIKSVTDRADIVSTLSSVSTLLSDPTLCASALTAVQKGTPSRVRVPDSLRSSDAGVLGAPYFSWESEVGQFQKVSSDQIRYVGLMGVPTQDGGLSQVLLASADAAELFGLPQTIPGNTNVRIAEMGLVRMTPKEDVRIDGESCRVQVQLRMVFEKVDRRISTGASRFERNFLLNARVKCPEGRMEGVHPLQSCGLQAPNNADLCLELGGVYSPTRPPADRCLFEQKRFANPHPAGSPSVIDYDTAIELDPNPLQGAAVSRGITDVFPGRIQLHGNGNTVQTLDTAIDQHGPSGQLAFSRSTGSLTGRGLIRGQPDRLSAQTSLGVITFRGLNSVTHPTYSGAPHNGREFVQAVGITASTDGNWTQNSSPSRINFTTTRSGVDTWFARPPLQSSFGNRPELIRQYPDSPDANAMTIPTLSVRESQALEAAAEIRFGVATRMGDGSPRSEPQPGQSYNGGTHPNTTASGLRVTHRRGGTLRVLTTPVSTPGYGYQSKLALSSESDLIQVLQLRNNETGENLDLEMRDLHARDLYLAQNNPKQNLSVLAAENDQGRARWLTPKYIKMAGSVNLTDSLQGELNLSRCIARSQGGSTQNIHGIYDGTDLNQINCHNLQFTNGDAIPNGHPILDRIGMTDTVGTRRSPTPTNPIQWDMCFLSENVIMPSSAATATNSSPTGCVIDITPNGWRLTGIKSSHTAIKCEAFCVKMVFE
jgi:hypothetical protein